MSLPNKPTAPPTFKDSKQRTWTLSLNLDILDAIQADTQVDLIGGGDVTALTTILFNRRKLGDILWVACQEQATRQSVDRKDFRSALDSDALTNGWGALVDAIVFFTPKETQAAIRAAFDQQMSALAQGCQVVARVAKGQTANEEIRKAIEKVEAEMTANLPTAFGNAADDSPPS